MAQIEKNENKQETVKKENFMVRGWKWTKRHGRDIGLGVALGLSVLNTAFIVLANINGVEAEIDADAIDSASDQFEMGAE